ncbi:hypothetical protein [Lewinella sp. LCG006]|uniref:hypothetical protein n=1 Tax=Lewinella sp. LCG006 TaxID=3231911 RepID=UPI0034600C57
MSNRPMTTLANGIAHLMLGIDPTRRVGYFRPSLYPTSDPPGHLRPGGGYGRAVARSITE